MTSDPTLSEQLRVAGHREGFARVGIAEAARLEAESAYLDNWLENGRHGQMDWMRATAEVRKDPRHPNMLEGARSVVVMAAPYVRDDANATSALRPARVAKYALGRDYHNVLGRRARRVAKVLERAGFRARVAVDSKPVFERAWAERAGVGFVGKNCCLIVPGLGSHVFLACIITSAPLEPSEPMARRCGSCTLCLDACPTRAFAKPRVLDARRCISYLTIEHRGSVPDEHREAIGEWVFGCDTCQDVCPYNQTARAEHAVLDAFVPDDRWTQVEMRSLLSMSEEAFAGWAEGSPLKRARAEGFARNVLIVLGNRGNRSHLQVLDEARQHHASGVVREAAQWAHERLTRRLAVEE
jgi:epoxyqueuosine reductase